MSSSLLACLCLLVTFLFPYSGQLGLCGFVEFVDHQVGSCLNKNQLTKQNQLTNQLNHETALGKEVQNDPEVQNRARNEINLGAFGKTGSEIRKATLALSFMLHDHESNLYQI